MMFVWMWRVVCKHDYVINNMEGERLDVRVRFLCGAKVEAVQPRLLMPGSNWSPTDE